MPTISTPEWVKHAIFYQIFPDRFCRSPRTQHVRGITFKPWGTPPEEQGYQGGDLHGIVDKLDYLQDLGITALYLNPIFSSASNHRYHAFDYLQIDPLLGGNEALRELLDESHARGMRVVLDFVPNHASRGFWPFHHILENGPNSPYLDWFHVTDWPLRPYSSDKDNPLNYAAWYGLPGLPKLNTDNPGVRDYLFQVTRFWLEFGIDGWRIDVPTEIDDDEFWREFRRIVKTVNPQAYIVGEIWLESKRWLQGDMYDAVMNYFFGQAAISFFGREKLLKSWNHPSLPISPIKAKEFAQKIEYFHGLYDWEINFAQLNMLDSHDTPRALWVLGEDKTALRLTTLFHMTMPGAPCIYYGSEIGLSSAGDPHCRAAFPWHKPETWDTKLADFYKSAIALRHRYPVLRTGAFEPLYAQDRVYAFRRELEDEQALVFFNAAQSPQTLPITGHQLENYHQAWPATPATVSPSDNSITIPAREAVVLIRSQ